MTLQQLRYLIAIAEYGSINAAAHNMFASQSNLSTAIKELEKEFGITIFRRSNRGVTLTNEGNELLTYARQIIDQVDMMESRYSHAEDANGSRARLAISTQHYSFSVQAFIQTTRSTQYPTYDFILRETTTENIINDVRDMRSDIGILYTDSFNRRMLEKTFEDAELDFHPLFEAKVHVFVGENHPLAKKSSISLSDLDPYPRYSFEQGDDSSFFFSEEPLGRLPHKRNIRITDRGTLSNLLANFDGYTITTGILSSEMIHGVVAIPLEHADTMRVGYLLRKDRRLGNLVKSYVDNLKAVIRDYEHEPEVHYLAD